jgi:hypothetical protein
LPLDLTHARPLPVCLSVWLLRATGHITKRLSVMGVLILSLVSYVLRFFIYASIRSPWEGLPAEALRGMTFAAMWASSTYYAHRIAPRGLTATMVRL